jgi:NADH-quinone oxidoreductase subunit G
MAKIVVDGHEIDVPADYTILQACEAAGAQIPRFCYHERLSVAGNCRMCLVEVKGAPKVVASCSQQVKDQRPGPNGEPPEVFTNSQKVQNSRKGVMEFLLINHPLDCPVCDQGGECDLQDQAVVYGGAETRYCEQKRAVEEKNMGPLIKTEMTRCIQCTRCVRFVTEVTGIPELGAIGRGEDMEITTYLEAALSSELSGNVVDLCPVGALTSAPYAFNARPWELRKTESIDVMDALGTNIRIDARGADVLRIEPRTNDEINEEWLSDKGRHACDGLRRQRLDKAYIRNNGKLAPAAINEAIALLAQKLGGDVAKIGIIGGDLVNVEALYAAKELAKNLGIKNIDCRQDGALLDDKAGRGGYIFNSTIQGIEEADYLLIIGSNPRLEAPVLNARIRKSWLGGKLQKIALVGAPYDLTYPYEILGQDTKILEDLAKGKGEFFKEFSEAKNPMIIVGMDAFARKDGDKVAKLVAEIGLKAKVVKDGWNGYNVLHNAAARVGGFDVGFLPQDGGLATNEILNDCDTIILIGADEVKVPEGKFVIYIGSHGDNGANRADLIIPAPAYTEKEGIYVNTEGRVQYASLAVSPKGDAKEEWAIFRAASAIIGQPLPFNSLGELRTKMRSEIASLNVNDGEIAPASDFELRMVGNGGSTESNPFVGQIGDYYFTNAIARASLIMAKCSALKSQSTNKVAAE